MISDRMIITTAIAAVLLLLAACNDKNTIEEGLVLHLAETHVEARAGVSQSTPAIIPASESVEGGYDQNNLEKHPIRDGNGVTLSLYRAYLVIDGIELVPCTSLAGLSGRLFGGIFPAANAHPGHGPEPVGGRSLDQPNVIDIITQEGFILPLGDKAIAPGRYCGVRVALVRLAGEGYGKPEFSPASVDDPTTAPEVPELSGRMFSLRADYCGEIDAGQCTRRVKVDVDDDGLTEPAAVTLEISPPIELNAVIREAYLVIGIAHGEWAVDVDATRLTVDIAERQKLLDNIIGSLHVSARGLGALPVNIVE